MEFYVESPSYFFNPVEIEKISRYALLLIVN